MYRKFRFEILVSSKIQLWFGNSDILYILDLLPGISVLGHFVFPELRVLNFDRLGWTDGHSIAFRYFCQNSPKLEEILIDISDIRFLDYNQMQIIAKSNRLQTVCDSVAKSIGQLISRPALQTLAFRIIKYRYISDTVNESIMTLLIGLIFDPYQDEPKSFLKFESFTKSRNNVWVPPMPCGKTETRTFNSFPDRTVIIYLRIGQWKLQFEISYPRYENRKKKRSRFNTNFQVQ